MRRHQARQLAAQAMYACALEGSPLETVLQRLPHVAESAAKAPPFVRDLCLKTHEHLAEIDAQITAIVEHWKPERLAAVDRALLRLAACEILFFPDIDAPVTLDEYIELARELGDDKSPAFINGVLDRLLAEHRKASAAPASNGET